MHLCDQNYNKNMKYYSNFLLQYYNQKYFMQKYLLSMTKLHFQHHYSSLQCHMILQKSF